jgi:GDPmannose 4,6-dehydratase
LFNRLAADGWQVIGLGRGVSRASKYGLGYPVDVEDSRAVSGMIAAGRVDAVFYLAAVHGSSEESQTLPDTDLLNRSWQVHVAGLANFLEALATRGTGSLFYAASSHVFGDPTEEPQNEQTPFRPKSIYGLTKAAGISVCRYYREQRQVKASAGILFNHESPLRGPSFVSQKIAGAAARIASGSREELSLGSLDARVDWGYAPDYVDAMIRIVSLQSGDDYVVATGESHSVREFAELAFARVGLDWRDHVLEQRPGRARQHVRLVGDAARLRRVTDWAPSVSFSEMVSLLVDAALAS